MYIYRPLRETLTNAELGKYESCGMRITTTVGTEESEVTVISDISPDMNTVAKLARICTEVQLDPLHVYDVIEDFLGTSTH